MFSQKVFSWFLVFFFFENIESIPIRKENSVISVKIGARSSDLITKAQSLISNLDVPGKQPQHSEDVNQIHKLLDNIESEIKEALKSTSEYVVKETNRRETLRRKAHEQAEKIHQDAIKAHGDALNEEELADAHVDSKEIDLDEAIETTNKLKESANETYNNDLRYLNSQSSDDYYTHCSGFQLVHTMRNTLEKFLNSDYEDKIWNYDQCKDCLATRTKCTYADFSDSERPCNECAMEFVMVQEGCMAIFNGNNTTAFPEGCDHCAKEINEICGTGEKACKGCVDNFVDDKGCEALEDISELNSTGNITSFDEVLSLAPMKTLFDAVPSGCFHCEDEARKRCFPVTAVTAGCADGSDDQVFSSGQMVGCDGSYTRYTMRTACASGWHVATASDYFDHGGVTTEPTADRWVDVTWDSSGFETSLDNWLGYFDRSNAGSWDSLSTSSSCVWVSTKEQCTLSFANYDYGKSYGCHCRGKGESGTIGVVCSKDNEV